MKILTTTFLLVLLLTASALRASEPTRVPDSPFDQYGAIAWQDEQARLDNFAIQLQNGEEYVGFILVFDDSGGCPGEAAARAVRAKRYIVEHRDIPGNRVGWRREGYRDGISTTLLIVPREAALPFPFYDPSGPQKDGPLTHACQARLTRIKRSRW